MYHLMLSSCQDSKINNVLELSNYHDSIHNCEQSLFYYCDSIIFTITQADNVDNSLGHPSMGHTYILEMG